MQPRSSRHPLSEDWLRAYRSLRRRLPQSSQQPTWCGYWSMRLPRWLLRRQARHMYFAPNVPRRKPQRLRLKNNKNNNLKYTITQSVRILLAILRPYGSISYCTTVWIILLLKISFSFSSFPNNKSTIISLASDPTACTHPLFSQYLSIIHPSMKEIGER